MPREHLAAAPRATRRSMVPETARGRGPGTRRRRWQDLRAGAWRSFNLDQLVERFASRASPHQRRDAGRGPGPGGVALRSFGADLVTRLALVLLVLLLAVPAALAGAVVIGVLALQRKPLPIGEEAEFYADDWPLE